MNANELDDHFISEWMRDKIAFALKMTTEVKSLPYHEPDIRTILIQSGLILALNVVNSALDSIIYCGLVGQLLIGIAWGVPGANWLNRDVQAVIQQFGFLGLILMVYEGELVPDSSGNNSPCQVVCQLRFPI